MTFDESTKYKTLIETIFQRQLDKPIAYHPTIMREFTKEERSIIFGGPYVLEDYIQEIDAVLRCVEHDNITSPRIILRACKMMIPRKISGFYDCNLQIELWVNSTSGEFLIESYDERRKLTKEEFLDLYR